MAKKTKESIESRIVIGAGRLAWRVITLPWRLSKSNQVFTNRPRQPLDYTAIKEQWDKIKMMVGSDQISRARMAVIEADKLFDSVLKSYAIKGETMGERLTNGRDILPPGTYQGVWEAHKIRNRMVHETDSEVMSWEVKTAIEQFEKGLKELKALR